jgi:hypothetical protein
MKKLFKIFRSSKKKKAEKIQHLVNLTIFARDKFQIQMNPNSKKEIKQIERLWAACYLKEDGTIRPGQETRKIIRKMKAEARKNK